VKTKKLLGTTLALAMILPSFGIANAAELFKNLKLSGQIDVMSLSARNARDFSTRSKPNTAAQAVDGVAIGAQGPQAENDRIGDTQTRLLLHLDWDLLDDVHAKLTLAKNNRNWGNVGATGAATAQNAQGQTITSGGGDTSLLGSIRVDQAYFKVDKVGGQVDATIGRQYYGNAGDIVIYFGPSDFPQIGLPTNAVDAARFDWSNDMLGVTGLAGKLAGRNPGAGIPNADVDLTGININIKGNDMWNGALYTWNVLTHANGALGSDAFNANGVIVPGQASANGKNDSLFITGAKLNLNGGGAWFKGEFAKDWGDNRVGLATNTSARYKGWMLHSNVGYKADVGGVGTFVPWGDFGYGTGQHDFQSNERRGFVAVSGDYHAGGIYSRFAPYGLGVTGGVQPGLATTVGPTGGVGTNQATNTLANRVITGLGFKFTPSALNKLTAGISAWDYHTATYSFPIGTPGSMLVQQSNGTNAALTPLSGNKHLGYEIDADFTWKHSENVSFDIGGGRFMPGGQIYEANQSTRIVNFGAPGGTTAGSGDASARSGMGVNPAVAAWFDARVKF